MASSRASTSRLSLEDWDTLSPLTPNEIASVQKVSTAASLKPLPHHLKQVQHENNTIDTPPLRSSSPTLNPSTNDTTTTIATTTRVGEPIESMQQFHDWFSKVESSLEHSQEQVFRNYLLELTNHLKLCNSILDGLEVSRGLLSEMEANYQYVEENSSSLQSACQEMLLEQKHLYTITEQIGQRLEYFRELESSTKMLNLPGEELVLKEDFLNMIDRLDICLDYLKANRDFRDSEIYLIRFQQCLTRSMTLIKMYFVSTIRKLSLETLEKLVGNRELSDTALQALLYSKFQTPASSLHHLLIELEKRSLLNPQEYSSLREECFQIWFNSRLQLLSPGLKREVESMEPFTTELIKLCRMGCNHLRRVCMQEWSLFKLYFSTGQDQVYRFLENLCDHLYDSLRPRILHEPRLEVLCELCTVLGAMMALDADTGLVEASDDEDDDDDDLSQLQQEEDDEEEEGDSVFGGGGIGMIRQSSTQTIKPSSSSSSSSRLGRLKFSHLLRTILQDVQTRLVFRAQQMIQSQVLHYVPNREDLDYPEILKRKELASSGKEPLWKIDEEEGGGDNDDTSGGSSFRVPNQNQMKWWYPTLRQTVWVLARLNSFVNPEIFKDFAGEAVTLCQQSLLTAARQITTMSQLDGQLFLVRHLLLLKETVRSVDLVHIERAADFSSVTEMLSNILRNSTTLVFNPSTLFQIASKGLPNFNETMFDSKTELDTQLKKACQELINTTSLHLTSPIQSFLDRCTSFLSTPSSSSSGGGATNSSDSSSSRDLSLQEWATPEQVLKLHQEFQTNLESQVLKICDQMRLYLEEEKTVKVLLPPLLEEVVETYTTFFNLTRSEYGFATSSSLLPPVDVKEKLKKATYFD
ncbi:hypothetical protein JCM3765_003400 [Sporobolomyces pararoseus]